MAATHIRVNRKKNFCKLAHWYLFRRFFRFSSCPECHFKCQYCRAYCAHDHKHFIVIAGLVNFETNCHYYGHGLYFSKANWHFGLRKKSFSFIWRLTYLSFLIKDKSWQWFLQTVPFFVFALAVYRTSL